MIAPKWQLDTPISSVIFDCDGTLSDLEGIDVLAEHNGVGQEVTALTKLAMETIGVSVDLYAKRLKLVSPTYEQVIQVANEYYMNRTPDSEEVIKILQRLNKQIYIISAGLLPPVSLFGRMLGVAPENIFAVDIYHDSEGVYRDYDKESLLVHRNGKRGYVCDIMRKHGTGVMIGDGINDFEARDLVTRFIGYGGMYYRKSLQDKCAYYLKAHSMAALLPLTLTADEALQLMDDEKNIYNKGLAAIIDGQVKI